MMKITIFNADLMQYIIHHQPEIIVNIGDLIRSEEKEIDLARYEHVAWWV